MCGRATLISPAEDIAELFEAEPIDIGPPRFNLAPSQPILTVRERDGARNLALVRWGLVPWWAKADEARRIASRCIQARAETVRRSPAFRDAFKRHRCLVVIDSFYEWRTSPGAKPGAKPARQPHLVRAATTTPLAVAGLWDRWRPEGEDGTQIETGAVVTTRAAGAIKGIHHRMPLVLPANEWSAWLSGSEEEAANLLAEDAAALERRAAGLVVLPVSTWVNDVRHDDERCVAPMTEPVSDAAAANDQIDFGFARKG